MTPHPTRSRRRTIHALGPVIAALTAVSVWAVPTAAAVTAPVETAASVTAAGGRNESSSSCSLREEAAVVGLTIGSGAINPAYLDEPRFAEVLGREFNSLSPENELKWSFVEPERGVFNFEGLDRLVAFAQEHGMAVKGHGLISGCCNPEYVTAITDPDEMRAALREHFEGVMGHYATTMDRWDVVTEPLSVMGGTGLVHNDFYNALGPDYIAEAFRIAHEADPDATLYVNENLVEFSPAKRQELYDLVSSLVDAGVPIDGVGLQMHETLASPDPGVITDMVESYKDLGLEVGITELDVHTYDSAQQAQIYGDVVAEALAAGVTDISVWGFSDAHLYTWLPGAKPLMFDEEYNAKPGYEAVRTALSDFVSPTAAPSAPRLSSTSGWTTGLRDGSYTVTGSLWWGTTASYYRVYENDQLIASGRPTTTGASRQSFRAEVSGRPNGTYVYRAEIVNAHGTTSSAPLTVTVTDANPGKPMVSTDNWDGDGDFTVTAHMWWGTNATSYQVLMDGAVIGSGDLSASTPHAQSVTHSVTGAPAGVHTITVVLANDQGATSSDPVSVTVR